MDNQVISISIPPFPDFIEGNKRIFKKNQYHPDRLDLSYFDLIFVKRGCLFLQEEDQNYEIGCNEMFILLPNKHHCSWKPCTEETEFYWIHFYTTAPWKQSDRPSRFTSSLPIPELHFHQKSYTLHLRKKATIKKPEMFFMLIQEILDSTKNELVEDIWKTEELFLRFLKFIENQGIFKDRLLVIAEQVQLFLENSYRKKVTNRTLEKHFHLHSNYLSKATKSVYGKTALEMLEEIRIDQAKKYLLNTNLQITEIAQLVGFNTEIYFSSRFRKNEGLSPQKYRKYYQNK